jgi:hypothetical protein
LGADTHWLVRRGDDLDVFLPHGRSIPTSGGDRSAAWACLRNPLVFGDLQGRRLGDVDHLPPLQAGLGRVD